MLKEGLEAMRVSFKPVYAETIQFKTDLLTYMAQGLNGRARDVDPAKNPSPEH